MADDQQQPAYKPTDGRRVQGKIQFPAQPSKKALDKLTGRHSELDNRPSEWSASKLLQLSKVQVQEHTN